jgi:hypothetical protein
MYAHEHPYFRAWAWTDANLIQNPQVNVAIYTSNSISPTQLSANVIDVTSSSGFLTSQYNTKSIILHNEFVDTASNISDWSNRRQEYITTVANISRGAYTWTSTSNAQVRYRQDYIGVSSSLYVGGSGSDYYYTGWTSRGTTWSGITDSDGIYSVDHNVAHDSLWNPYYRINFDIDHYASGDWSNKEIMIKKCGVKVTGNASFSSDTLTATFDTYASYPTLDYDLSNTQIKNSNDVLSSSLLFLGVVENSSSMNNAPWYTGNYAGDILEKRDAFYLNGQWYSGWYSDPTQLNITSRLSDSGWQSTRPVVTLAMPMYGIKFPTGVTNVKMFYKLRFGYYKASSSSSTPVYTLVDGPTLVFNYNVS